MVSELQRLISSSSEESGAGSPFSWTEELREMNEPVSLNEVLARLPPAPTRRQVARRQRPTGLVVEPIRVFPPPPTVRERAEEVGRRVCQRVVQLTRAMQRWVVRHRD